MNRLARHLSYQGQVLKEFVELLEHEQKLLSSSEVDGEAVRKLATDKKTMLERLESLESQRAKGQHTLGYPSGLEGAKKAASDSKCLPFWEEITLLAFRAKSLNEINGNLIKMRLDHANQMISFFNKVAGEPLYGPDGKSKRRGMGGITTSA